MKKRCCWFWICVYMMMLMYRAFFFLQTPKPIHKIKFIFAESSEWKIAESICAFVCSFIRWYFSHFCCIISTHRHLYSARIFVWLLFPSVLFDVSFGIDSNRKQICMNKSPIIASIYICLRDTLCECWVRESCISYAFSDWKIYKYDICGKSAAQLELQRNCCCDRMWWQQQYAGSSTRKRRYWHPPDYAAVVISIDCGLFAYRQKWNQNLFHSVLFIIANIKIICQATLFRILMASANKNLRFIFCVYWFIHVIALGKNIRFWNRRKISGIN